MSIYAAKRFEVWVKGLFGAFGDSLVSSPVDAFELTLNGIAGDRHEGATRKTGGREPWYERGTEIRNERQLSLVCADELAEVANAMDIDAIKPEWIGANITLGGLPSLSKLPPRTLLTFSSGATVKIDGQNAPCRFAGDAIAQNYPDKDPKALALAFPKAASGKRGLVGWVERPGTVTTGDTVTVQVPQQWMWPD